MKKLFVFMISLLSVMNVLAVTANTLEFNITVDLCKKSIVRTTANIVAGMDLCTSLLYEDVACQNKLSVSTLCAETLGFGITAVLCRAASLFMCE